MKPVSESNRSEREWLVRLFQKSVLKQRKLREITERLGQTEGLDCLDIGSDNGVISYLLRQRGGRWTSADLDPQAVAAIARLVQSRVYRFDGGRTPFEEASFDRIAIVDFLEHIPDDYGFVQEMARILRPDGVLVVNVPHRKDGLLRKLRYRLGQTDEKHGHLRPGYTRQDLERLLGQEFNLESTATYSGFFSELLDTLIVFVVGKLQGSRKEHSQKGLMVTGEDLKKNTKLFRAYSFIYPVVWFFAQLDRLLVFSSGYMLIGKARVKKQNVPRPTRAETLAFEQALQSQNGGRGKDRAKDT